MQFVPIDEIRITRKQFKKLSRNRIERHKQTLSSGVIDDLMPIDVCVLADNTYTVNWEWAT